MMGVFAESLCSIIQERVRAGLARAKDEGTTWVDPMRKRRIQDAPNEPDRPGVRLVAKQFGGAVGTCNGSAALSS
jgi:DNA invertase Pin-like site-specific DNA recombinase